MKETWKQWMIFIPALILMGLWFPAMFFRDDEKYMLKQNFGLNVKDADGNLSDGVEEAFGRIGQNWKRILHDVKNVAHEWVKGRPKLACKFLCFIIVVQAVVIATLIFW
jgi:hypothetical protein